MMLVVKAAPVFAATKGGRHGSVGGVAPNEHAASHCLRFLAGSNQSWKSRSCKIPSSFYASDCPPSRYRFRDVVPEAQFPRRPSPLKKSFVPFSECTLLPEKTSCTNISSGQRCCGSTSAQATVESSSFDSFARCWRRI